MGSEAAGLPAVRWSRLRRRNAREVAGQVRTPLSKWIHLAGMFVFALEIPVVSPAILLVVAVIATTGLLKQTRIFGFVWRLGLLSAAMALHFLIAVGHGFVEPLFGVARAVLAVVAYAAGYMAAQDRQGATPRGAFAGLLAGVFGSVVFTLLCVRLAIARGVLEMSSVAAAMDRWAPSPWGGEKGINATGLGAFGCLGMVLLPAVLFSPAADRKGNRLLWLGMLAAVAGGFFSNFVLQNRTPFVAVALALAAGTLLYFTSAETRRRNKWLASFAVVMVVLILGSYAAESLSSFGVLQRFESEGLATARYDLWLTVISHMFQTLDGGRIVGLPEHYAHNLWLDVAWDSGPITFFLLVAFHLSHVLPVGRALRRVGLLTRLIVAGLCIAFLATCMAEPVLSMTITYFTLTCYALGLLLAVSSKRTAARGPPAAWSPAQRGR